MTLYCGNGHRQTENVVIGNVDTGGRKCPVCRATLLEYVPADPVRRWPVVLVVFVALALVGVWWWWMWLAPR